MVFFRSCRSEARSDGVSILDTNEIPCLAFREAVEAVPEGALPPVFDEFAMLLSKSSQRTRLQRECGGIGPTGQCCRPEHATATVHQEPSQVGERATLADEVVNHEVILPGGHGAIENGWANHALPAGCTGVIDDICLDNADLDVKT